MLAYIISKLVTLTYGLMYPAYCSFKAVKTKDVREYVNWMMYWIAFAVFSVVEIFTDTFIGCWFPFYYELKILFLLWMISSSTRGGSVLYRRYIHPTLLRHEKEIDACLADFKSRASGAVMKWGHRLFTSFTEAIMAAMFRGGEPLINNFRRTCSMNDLNRGYSHRYMGPPPGNRDMVDGFALQGQGNEFYFERNVPVHAIGDHEIIHETDSENNVARRMSTEFLPVDPDLIVDEGMSSDVEPTETRRLRSRTRKRNPEREVLSSEYISTEGTPVRVVYEWFPVSRIDPDSFSIACAPNVFPESNMRQIPYLSPLESSIPETEEFSDSGDEFFDCDTTETVGNRQIESKSPVSSEDQNPVIPKRTIKSANVKTVGKTVLQGFESPVPASAVPAGRLQNIRVGSTTAHALVTNPVHVISSVATPTVAKDRPKSSGSSACCSTVVAFPKLKHSHSFAGRGNHDNFRPRPHLSWHASSFRRVLNPFSAPSPKPADSANGTSSNSGCENQTSTGPPSK